MLLPSEIVQFLQGRQPQQASPINRGAPAVPASIPVPGNQNMNPGGYMQQAMQLSGVPAANQTAMIPQQQPQQNPQPAASLVETASTSSSRLNLQSLSTILSFALSS